jgi:hypothetical protein
MALTESERAELTVVLREMAEEAHDLSDRVNQLFSRVTEDRPHLRAARADERGSASRPSTRGSRP